MRTIAPYVLRRIHCLMIRMLPLRLRDAAEGRRSRREWLRRQAWLGRFNVSPTHEWNGNL